MGQIAIVNIGGRYFREYAVEAGDSLSSICLRFGHLNWSCIYNLSENSPFRTRYPDPNVIDTTNHVNLFIPLHMKGSGGRSVRAKLLKEFLIIRIVEENGTPLANTGLRLIAPKGSFHDWKHDGWEVITNDQGEIIVPNPMVGQWYLASAEYMLAEPTVWSDDILKGLQTGSLPDPNPDYPLTLDAINHVIARPVFYVSCPTCGRTIRLIKGIGATTDCPNDLTDLGPIVTLIETAPDSFIPKILQDPKKTPFSLACRGMFTLTTAHGEVNVYWDESRFTYPENNDYELWGNYYGTWLKVKVIGRKTWGATPPETVEPDENGKPRVYESHYTEQGKNTAYPDTRIPDNLWTPLAQVLRWITIHHTNKTDSGGYDTVRDLQKKHRDEDGIEGAGLAADIGYHFIIGKDGKIYEGRPLGIKGSHVVGFNGGNIGIVLAGDFHPADFSERFSAIPDPTSGTDPTAEALNALQNLLSRPPNSA
jgi:hypothetical protein